MVGIIVHNYKETIESKLYVTICFLNNGIVACYHTILIFFNLQVEYDFLQKSYWNLVTNNKLADVFRRNGEVIGIQFSKKEHHTPASTDMGNVYQILPNIHSIFKLDTDSTPHCKEFAAAAGQTRYIYISQLKKKILF